MVCMSSGELLRPGNRFLLSCITFFELNQTRKGGRDTENISQVKKKSAKTLRRELKLYRENGVSLYLNGEPSTPKKIAKACQIAEDGVYMRDYTEDEEGHIACVSFDLIRKM